MLPSSQPDPFGRRIAIPKGIRHAIFVGCYDEAHLRDRQKQPHRFESVNDRVRQASVEVIDQHHDPSQMY